MTDEQLKGLMLYALDRLKRFQELTEESIKNLKGEVK